MLICHERLPKMKAGTSLDQTPCDERRIFVNKVRPTRHYRCNQ